MECYIFDLTLESVRPFLFSSIILNSIINILHRSLELTRIMTEWQMKDMDSKGNKLLPMVKQYGRKVLQDNPDIFLTMVKKASNLIQSPHYTKIMQARIRHSFIDLQLLSKEI